MNTKPPEERYAIIIEIAAETDKAYFGVYRIPQFDFESKGWLAKSQLRDLEINGTSARATISDWFRRLHMNRNESDGDVRFLRH